MVALMLIGGLVWTGLAFALGHWAGKRWPLPWAGGLACGLSGLSWVLWYQAENANGWGAMVLVPLAMALVLLPLAAFFIGLVIGYLGKQSEAKA